jgi:hypothetical protein
MRPLRRMGSSATFEKEWEKVNSGKEAAQQASTGTFVLAGLLSTEHKAKPDGPVKDGHIVIVVDGPLDRQKYPMCWGASSAGRISKGDHSVGWVWSPHDRDKVTYHAYRTPTTKTG